MSATASILLACVVFGLALAAPIIRWLRARQIRQQRAMRRASADIARERMGVRMGLRLHGERQWRDDIRSGK